MPSYFGGHLLNIPIIASRVGAKKEGVDIHTFFTINMNP